MKALVKVSIKIMALYFLSVGIFNSIGLITSFAVQFYSVSKDISIMRFIIMPVSYIGFGILFWNISDSISNKILSKTDSLEDKISLSISTDIVLKTSIIIVGVIAVVFSIPKIISGIFMISSLKGLEMSSLILKEKASVVENTVKTISGIVLIFGFRGICKMICNLGSFGIYKGEENDSNNQ